MDDSTLLKELTELREKVRKFELAEELEQKRKHETKAEYMIRYYHEHKNVLEKQKILKKDRYANDPEYREKIKARNRKYSKYNPEYAKKYYQEKKKQKIKVEEE